MITCLLLSAGHSERFGSPKALAPFRGKTVIEHIQQMLLETSCDEIIVVLGAHGHQIWPLIFNHNRIRFVYNKNYNFGQLSSVQEGWRYATEPSEGVMCLPVDCPLVQASSIEEIITCFKKDQPDILVPCYQDKKGHPPILHSRLKKDVLDLPMDRGLNSIFTDHPPKTININDDGLIKSFNTKEELESLNK